MRFPKLSGLVVHSSLLMTARVVGAAMAFATQIIIARCFGAEALGMLALAIALANVLACFSSLGFQSVAIFFVSEYHAKNRLDLARGFTLTSRRDTMLTTIVLTIVLITAVFLMGDLLSAEKRLPLTVGIIIGPALAAIHLNAGIALGCRRHFVGALPDTLFRPALALLGFGLAALLAPKASATHLLVLLCILIWVVALTQWLFIVRAKLIPRSINAAYETSRWRQVALPWLVIALLSEFFVDIDILLISWLTSTADIAVLSACFRIRILFGFGLRTLYNLVLPDLHTIDNAEGSKAVQKNLDHANIVALTYTTITLVGVILMGKYLLGLFGPVFQSGHTALIVLLASLVVRAAFGPTTIALTMRGFQTSAVWVMVVGIILLVGLNLFFVPRFGIDGAAIAAGISQVFLSIGLWWKVRQKTGNDVSIFALLRRNENRLSERLSSEPATDNNNKT